MRSCAIRDPNSTATLSIPAFSAEPAVLTVQVYDRASVGSALDQIFNVALPSTASRPVRALPQNLGRPPLGPRGILKGLPEG